MIKGCKHKLALICKQNLNALVFFLQNEVNVRFHLMMGTIVLNRKLLFCYNSTTLLIRKRLGDHPFGGLSRWKELVYLLRKDSQDRTKGGKLQGAELAFSAIITLIRAEGRG